MEKLNNTQLQAIADRDDPIHEGIIADLLQTRAELDGYKKWMNADKLMLGTSVNIERGTVMIICNPDDADKFVKTEDEHGKID